MGLKIGIPPPKVSLRYVENCKASRDEGVIINLSPHFVIPDPDSHTDHSFPWMQQAFDLFKIQELMEHSKTKGQRIFDLYVMLGGIPYLPELWQILRKAWSLTNSGRADLAASYLRQLLPPDFKGELNLDTVLARFCSLMLAPRRIQAYMGASQLAQQAKNQFEPEFKRFVDYYQRRMESKHRARYLDILSEYFSKYSEFDQTILYAKNGIEVPDDCVATSKGFQGTRMYYGNAFENYTSNLCTLACINNILEGRPFDQFGSMTLAKYLSTDKASRGKPLEDRPECEPFLKPLESMLRNASHHMAMNLVDRRRTIEYRSGGTGAKRTISYAKYLLKCNEITLAAIALFLLELTMKS